MHYVKDVLNFELSIAKTGVKYLHHKAKQYDLSVYFESNGHGTLTFDERLTSKLNKLNSFAMNSTDSQILELFNIYINMFNKTTGDSLSAMICTEASLKLMNMTLLELYDIYNELPSINLKVEVKDKLQFKANENELQLIEPLEIQNFIDKTIKEFQKARCFVRPSGTEDIVRIYAEAASEQEALKIATIVKDKINELYA